MTTINLTIGANDCTILSFRTKRNGYGSGKLIDGDIDAIDADVMIQLALFNEVQFS